MAPQVGTIGRTFRAVFDFPILKKESKPKRAKKSRKYRNLVCLALEWNKMIENGECASQAELARKLGVSRARVSQVMRFLMLDPEVLSCIAALGDSLHTPIVTERILSGIMSLPTEEQKKKVKKIWDFGK